MNEKIKKVTNKEQIITLLTYFADEMPRIFAKINSVDDYAEKLSKKAEVLVLYENMEPLGFIAFYDNNPGLIAFISLLIVHEEYRHHGYGTVLLDYGLNLMKKHGMKKIQLEVDPLNHAVIAFYEKNGYRVETQDERIIMSRSVD